MFEIKIKQIPVVAEVGNLAASVDEVNSGGIPGFLMPPQLLTEMLGRSVFDITKIMAEVEQPDAFPQLKILLGGFLDKYFGIDVRADGFPIHLNEVGVSYGDKYNSHTDDGYAGGVLHLQGRIPEGHSARGVEFATVQSAWGGGIPLALRDCVPIGTTVFEGEVEEGWGSYFLAKDPAGENRTAHRFSGYGQFARFGDYTPEMIKILKEIRSI